jgi:hypothetical protein
MWNFLTAANSVSNQCFEGRLTLNTGQATAEEADAGAADSLTGLRVLAGAGAELGPFYAQTILGRGESGHAQGGEEGVEAELHGGWLFGLVRHRHN